MPGGNSLVNQSFMSYLVAPMGVIAMTELIGINEQVDQNDYSKSAAVALGGTYSGEILSIEMYTTEDDAGVGGAILVPDGVLYIFSADPTIAFGDTSISAAERLTLLGEKKIFAADWSSDANGGSAWLITAIPFHPLATLYFAFKLTSATSFNSAAGDDERLRFRIWYRRDS